MVVLNFKYGKNRGKGFATAVLIDGQKLVVEIEKGLFGEKGYVALLTFVGKHKSVNHPQMNSTKVIVASKRSDLIDRIQNTFN